MRTFKYEMDESAFLKHIFTCNRKSLQGEATFLFEEIQRHVPLSRDIATGTALTGIKIQLVQFFADRLSRSLFQLPGRPSLKPWRSSMEGRTSPSSPGP
jgi:hypothetical protein